MENEELMKKAISAGAWVNTDLNVPKNVLVHAIKHGAQVSGNVFGRIDLEDATKIAEQTRYLSKNFLNSFAERAYEENDSKAFKLAISRGAEVTLTRALLSQINDGLGLGK